MGLRLWMPEGPPHPEHTSSVSSTHRISQVNYELSKRTHHREDE